MKILIAALTFLIFFAGTKEPTLSVPDEKQVIGTKMPDVSFVDEFGAQKKLSDFAGAPLVVLPVYTSCGGVCPRIAMELKKAALGAQDDFNTYRVFLFSFDPKDTTKNLAEFREMHSLPGAWVLGKLEPSDIKKITEAMDYRTAKDGDEWLHPNAVGFLDKDQRLVKFMYGTRFASDDFQRALVVARGGKDWLGKLIPYGIGLSTLGLIFSIIWFVHLVGRRRKNLQEIPA